MTKFKIGDRVIYHTDVTYLYNVIDVRGDADAEVRIQTHRIRQDGGEVEGTLQDCGWYPAANFKLDTEIRPRDAVLYRPAYARGSYKDKTTYYILKIEGDELHFGLTAEETPTAWQKLPLRDWVRADQAPDTNGVKVGDRVQVQITVEVADVQSDGYDFRTDESGRFHVSKKDIDGQPRVLKPIPQPLRVGQSLTLSGSAFTVLNLLDNDWAVILRDGTNADYKLIHKNDPKVERKVN